MIRLGAVLSGGMATRYGGVAKGMLKMRADGTIIGGLLAALEETGLGECVVIANDPEPYRGLGRRVVGDARKGCGPLGGIETALGLVDEGGVFVVPCDLPGLGVGQLVELKEAFERSSAGLVYAMTEDGREHPLCAVVDRRHLGAVRAALDRGERGVGAVWRSLGGTAVRFDDARPFFNVNSAEEMATWRKGL